MFDNTFGNLTDRDMDRLSNAFRIESEDHEQGDTEPWISQLVGCLALAINAHAILETGGYRGATSRILAEALVRLGGGQLTVCEIDGPRAQALYELLNNEFAFAKTLEWDVVNDDALKALTHRRPASLDLIWLDDDHEMLHVQQEAEVALTKLRPGGLLLFHDVTGLCDLQQVVRHYGGWVLECPRLGPAGGLGVVQAGK